MRALALIALLAGPAAADPFQPAPGLYCPEGPDVAAIVVGPAPGEVGIDLLECHGARIAGGRVTSRQCYGNGGRPVPYDAELVLLPSGVLLHDGVRYRRQPSGGRARRPENARIGGCCSAFHERGRISLAV